jgi:ATP-dependent RNA helicase DeaD
MEEAASNLVKDEFIIYHPYTMQTFAETGLKPSLLMALEELGFETPTPIQAKTIPHLLNSDQDLVALAQTGTGKTAAFSLPVINRIDPELKHVQTIILCPTRELCLQIARDIEKFIKFLDGVNVTAVYGGEYVGKQIKALSKGPQIVVGTPGRVLDLIKRRNLKIDNIQWLVLDEADEMLNMGFKEELDAILSETPADKQTLLFSATMPRSIESIAKKYMRDAYEISAGTKNTGADNVQHLYYLVHARDRYTALRRIADANPNIYSIVFCRTRQETKDVSDKLIRDGYSAEALHGDIAQSQREHVMARFRKKQTQILVATDVAARGIDVDNLTHVINYNLPDKLESYIHRSGRTGRANSSGISIAIAHMKEQYKLRLIERKIGKPFEKGRIPTGKEICEKQLLHLIDTVQKVEVNEGQIAAFMPAIYEKMESMTREELIKHFVSMEFNRFLAFYKDAPDLNVASGRGRDSRDGRDRGNQRERFDRNAPRNQGGQMPRFRINMGRKHNFSAKDLLGMINNNPSLQRIDIGKIEIKNTNSFFEVDAANGQTIIKCLQKAQHQGIPVVIDKDPNSSGSSQSYRGGGMSRGRSGGGGGYSRSRSGGGGGYSRSRGGGSSRSRSGGSSEGGYSRKRY